MKQVRIIVLLVNITAFVTLFSCTKDEGPKFSCDEKAHKYAVMHQDANQRITRDSLVKLERGLQFAVFRSLTPKNKKRIFNEKIDLLLSTVTLNSSERAHLIALQNYYEPSMYHSGKETPFIVQWALNAKNTLGWTDNIIQGMVGTWATPEELVTMARFNNMETAGSSCTCNYDISCSGIGDCIEAGCNKTANGCGLIGSVPCKGNCPEDRTGPSGGGIAL